MKIWLLSGVLLFTATTTTAADVCYRIRIDATKEEFHVVYLTPGLALEGWAGGCSSCWSGLGVSEIGGIPGGGVPPDRRFRAFDLAFQVEHWGTARVRCLRAHCVLRASESDTSGDATTLELSRFQTAEVPAQAYLDILLEDPAGGVDAKPPR